MLLSKKNNLTEMGRFFGCLQQKAEKRGLLSARLYNIQGLLIPSRSKIATHAAFTLLKTR
jgi:hypothetical protein